MVLTTCHIVSHPQVVNQTSQVRIGITKEEIQKDHQVTVALA
jgi:hypothetical protein